MTLTNHPEKELVRQWLLQRRLNPGPLPDRELIQHQLGWNQSEAKYPADQMLHRHINSENF